MTSQRIVPGMALLDDAIEASGGLVHWNEFERFTLQLSINGTLLSRAGHGSRFKEVVAQGSTRYQSVQFTGFSDPIECGFYQPSCVTIESPEGKVLRTWRDPEKAFRDQARTMPWDELLAICFCGFSVWNYLTAPFHLAHPEVQLEELSPWHEQDQQWRRLRAIFPPSFVTHSQEQIFYFNEEGLQQRTDHDLLESRVAQYSWAHQSFNGIVIPTLRRSLALLPDGTILTKVPLFDLEIFDASFD